MTADRTPSDRLYDGIATLPGWDRALQRAGAVRDMYSTRVGAVVSSVLLAAGESEEAIAVAGKLSDDDRGYLAVVYGGGIVHVHVEALTAEDSDVRVSVYSFGDVERLDVRSQDSYFRRHGNGGQPVRIEFDIDINGHLATFKPGSPARSPLTEPDAVHKAFERIRDARSL